MTNNAGSTRLAGGKQAAIECQETLTGSRKDLTKSCVAGKESGRRKAGQHDKFYHPSGAGRFSTLSGPNSSLSAQNATDSAQRSCVSSVHRRHPLAVIGD